MPRTLGVSLKSHYQSQVTTLAFCCRITLAIRQPRITNITRANPGVVTTRWPHGFIDGDSIKIVGVEGMTQVNYDFDGNPTYYMATVIDTTHFSIGVDTSAYSSYVAGSWYGTARKTMGFTNHETDLTVDGVVHKAASGADGSAVAANTDLSLTTRDLHTLLDDDRINIIDVENGLYAGAEYETFEVNYQNLGLGKLMLEYGRLGDISVTDLGFMAEGLGLANILAQQIGPTISVTCRAQLGTRISDTFDQRYGCKVRLNPPTWIAATAYTAILQFDAGLGSIVKPSVYNGFHFQCTTAGTSGGSEPVWGAAVGATTADGSAVWTAVEAKTKEGVVLDATDRRTFRANDRTEPGDVFLSAIAIAAVTASSFTVAGDLTEQFWPGDVFLVTGSTGNNGVYTVSSRSFVDSQTTISTTETVPDGTADGTITAARPGRFTGGLLTFYTGDNAGFASEVKKYELTSYPIVNIVQGSKRFDISGDQTAFFTAADVFLISASAANNGRYTVSTVTYDSGSGRTRIVVVESIPSGSADGNIVWRPANFTLRDKALNDIQPGDLYEVEVACNKTLAMCRDVFKNIYNFRGEPYIPGFHRQFLYPDGH